MDKKKTPKRPASSSFLKKFGHELQHPVVKRKGLGSSHRPANAPQGAPSPSGRPIYAEAGELEVSLVYLGQCLLSSELSAIQTPDAIERMRLETRIEQLKLQRFEYRKQYDILKWAFGQENSESFPAERSKVFISATQADRPWSDRIRRHLASLGQDAVVDSWDESRMEPGTIWRVRIEQAIAASLIIIPLLSADYLASDEVIDDILPLVLRKAETSEVIVLPLVLKPCQFAMTGLVRYPSVNNPSSPLFGKSEREQDRTLRNLADSVARFLTHALATG
jgi:hypothetical protein